MHNLVEQIRHHFFWIEIANFSKFLGFGQIACKIGQCYVVETIRELYLLLSLTQTFNQCLSKDLFLEIAQNLQLNEFIFDITLATF